jgi:hypothetical protein
VLVEAIGSDRAAVTLNADAAIMQTAPQFVGVQVYNTLTGYRYILMIGTDDTPGGQQLFVQKNTHGLPNLRNAIAFDPAQQAQGTAS